MKYQLTEKDNFLLKFEKTVKECWDMPALSDYNVSTITYGQFAEKIEKNNLLWKAAGLVAGDKIGVNAKSCSAWASTWFSTQVGQFVASLIFPGFTPSDTAGLVNHSEARILYTDKAIASKLDFESMPNLLGVIEITSGELLASRNGFDELYAKVDEMFAAAHPDGLVPSDIDYSGSTLSTLSSIMYTSGSTGNPKGVMLTNENYSSQVYVLPFHVPFQRGDCTVSVLPYAHIFGMTVDMVTPLCMGMHLVTLCLPPAPSFLKPALLRYKPKVFFAVPLILTKLMEDTIGEFVHSQGGAAKLADYENHPDFCEALATIFLKAMGGELKLMCTGGAAIPEAFEELFVKKLKLPFITGYGMTETTPVISIGTLGCYKLRECGEYLDEILDLKINSPEPDTIPGEILVKGYNIFSGYYKNEAATKAAFTEDGWFCTGDLATLDSEKSIFIVGRSKNMILSSDGQNIFPEEIEVVLNDMPYVGESLVVLRNERLVALIVPDPNMTEGISSDNLKNIMKANVEALNKRIPGYSQVTNFEIRIEPFAKTPKGSIKRFMYE